MRSWYCYTVKTDWYQYHDRQMCHWCKKQSPETNPVICKLLTYEQVVDDKQNNRKEVSLINGVGLPDIHGEKSNNLHHSQKGNVNGP